MYPNSTLFPYHVARHVFIPCGMPCFYTLWHCVQIFFSKSAGFDPKSAKKHQPFFALVLDFLLALGPGAGLARSAKPTGRPATPKAWPGPGRASSPPVKNMKK